MVRINAFTGITYNFNKFSILKDLIAPPYDVISPKYQSDLYDKSPYNVVRLILGKIYDSDNESNSRYTRASADFKQWLDEGVLVQSDVPKIYYYVQKYKDAKGKEITRKGFIARCYLEDFSEGIVLPHEETMGGPKKDRLNLMESTNTNFSQIFSIYSDPKMTVESLLDSICNSNAIVDVLDDDNVRHIFYEVSEPSVISKIKTFMKEKVVLIADGHHRYETALQYRNNQRAKYGNDISEETSYNSVMMYFANMDDDGLRVYPTHRLLKNTGNVNLDELQVRIEEYFNVSASEFNDMQNCFDLMEKQPLQDLSIGVICKKHPGMFFILKPKSEKVAEELKKLNVPPILAKLDVAILHKLILEGFMGLDTVEMKTQNNLEFIRDEYELKEKFQSNIADMIFLLNSPDVNIVKEICLSGQRMPQKTTYFYPKLLSGLVINPLY